MNIFEKRKLVLGEAKVEQEIHPALSDDYSHDEALEDMDIDNENSDVLGDLDDAIEDIQNRINSYVEERDAHGDAQESLSRAANDLPPPQDKHIDNIIAYHGSMKEKEDPEVKILERELKHLVDMRDRINGKVDSGTKLLESAKTPSKKSFSIVDIFDKHYNTYPKDVKKSVDAIRKHLDRKENPPKSERKKVSNVKSRFDGDYNLKGSEKRTAYREDFQITEAKKPEEEETDGFVHPRVATKYLSHLYEQKMALALHAKSAQARKAKGLPPHSDEQNKRMDEIRSAYDKHLARALAKAKHPSTNKKVLKGKTPEQFISDNVDTLSKNANHSASIFLNSLYHNHGKEPHEIDEVHHTEDATGVKNLLRSSGHEPGPNFTQNANPSDVSVKFTDGTLRGASLKKGGGAIGGASIPVLDSIFGTNHTEKLYNARRDLLDKHGVGHNGVPNTVSRKAKALLKKLTNNSKGFSIHKAESNKLDREIHQEFQDSFDNADKETQDRYLKKVMKMDNHPALPYDYVNSDSKKSDSGGLMSDADFNKFMPNESTKNDEMSHDWGKDKHVQLIKKAKSYMTRRMGDYNLDIADHNGNVIVNTLGGRLSKTLPFDGSPGTGVTVGNGRKLSDKKKPDYIHTPPKDHDIQTLPNGDETPVYRDSVNVPASSSNLYGNPSIKEKRKSMTHYPNYEEFDKADRKDPVAKRLFQNSDNSHYFHTMHQAYKEHHEMEESALKNDTHGAKAVAHHLLKMGVPRDRINSAEFEEHFNKPDFDEHKEEVRSGKSELQFQHKALANKHEEFTPGKQKRTTAGYLRNLHDHTHGDGTKKLNKAHEHYENTTQSLAKKIKKSMDSNVKAPKPVTEGLGVFEKRRLFLKNR